MTRYEIMTLTVLRARYTEDGPGAVSWFGGVGSYDAGASDPDYRAWRDAIRLLVKKGLAAIVSADRKWITARLTRKGIAHVSATVMERAS